MGVGMNERIKELAEQAGIAAGFYGYNAWYNEKFAELIVRECADFVSEDRQNDEYGQFVSSRIKKHFGVEE